ncbi:Ran-binding protein 3 [Amphibalanus amphitrite]|uniref:Ran-binding protein 3 n=1 Tax=Amphibalanus amphitrite TaxID=1232801 RepID=A0A6A4VTF4_AMPAM|nr:ran-binding protein 3-like isoform X2 [Amphibalanus amphitrite]KAF0292621.1 Ran-binding protein 3 [Amphibalanus amphitrite]
MSQQDSNDTPKAQSTGSDKESMDRFTDPPESSDCSNHSTTDKDSEVSDSDSRLGSARNEAAAMPQPPLRPRPAAPYHQSANSGSAGSVLAPSRLGNPFARVAAPVVRSSADSSEHRPLSGGVLAPSRLGGVGGSAAAVSSSRSVLRPSALSVPAASLKTPETNGLGGSTFTLHPPKFNNPFAAKAAPEEDSEDSPAAPECASTETASRRPAGAAPAAAAAAAPPAVNETVTSTSGSNGFTLQAAAERRSEETESASISSSSGAGGGFVFGQNLEDRVTNAAAAAAEPASAVSSSGDEPPAEGATGEPAGDQAAPPSQPAAGLSLRESAAVYEKQRTSKRKYDEVEVVTGEEEESNVLQINCKLYAFNKENCSWLERGRGLLRLNDRREEAGGGGPLQSRLVFRTQGSLRLVLNTKIWPAMSVEKPSEKDVRVTAMDNDQVKVFLIKSSTKDAELLFNALDYRLSGLRAAESADGSDAEAAAKKARQQEGDASQN